MSYRLAISPLLEGKLIDQYEENRSRKNTGYKYANHFERTSPKNLNLFL